VNRNLKVNKGNKVLFVQFLKQLFFYIPVGKVDRKVCAAHLQHASQSDRMGTSGPEERINMLKDFKRGPDVVRTIRHQAVEIVSNFVH